MLLRSLKGPKSCPLLPGYFTPFLEVKKGGQGDSVSRNSKSRVCLNVACGRGRSVRQFCGCTVYIKTKNSSHALAGSAIKINDWKDVVLRRDFLSILAASNASFYAALLLSVDTF